MSVNSLIRTTSDNTDFKNLVALLDAFLKITDGDEHSFYDQFNKIDTIKNVVVFYVDNVAVGCGAFKVYDSKSVEIKRMFVHSDFRGKGIAAKIISELELWAKELNYLESILETGNKQTAAIALYLKSDYKIIANYGQYSTVENSIFMKKKL
jgi:putative acetyltransferase